jgi:hypothetical protein
MNFKTLHEAIIDVLKRNKKPMSFEEIAAAIKKKNLWKRPSDGTYPEAFQIRLRTVVRATYKKYFKQQSDSKIILNK